MRTGSRVGYTSVVAGLLGVMLVAGCAADSGSDDAAAADYELAQEDAAYDSADMAGDGAGADAGGAEAYDEALEQSGSAVDPAAAGARMVIQTGWISLVSDDPVATANAVVGIVTASGGRTDNRSVVAASEYQKPSASLTVRIPADALDGVLEQISSQGDLLESSISAEDVTLTGQDLDARIEAKELSVERLENLLAGATTSEDIINAEQTLTQRQSELEQLKAERAWLGEQVALSTISVSISLPDDVPVTPPTGFTGGLSNGWDALTGSLVTMMAVVGYLLPWLVIIGLVVALVVWARRRWGTPKQAEANQNKPAQAPVPAGVAAAPGGAPKAAEPNTAEPKTPETPTDKGAS